MTRPNRRLSLELSYEAANAPCEFQPRVEQAVNKLNNTEELLHRSYVSEPNKFDAEELFSLTVDGYPNQLDKKTFKVRIERAQCSEDNTLFRVHVEWFGVNHEDVAEMEERGTEILQSVHECLMLELDINHPTGEVYTASKPGRTY